MTTESTATETPSDLIPLAAAAVVLGYTPASAPVLIARGSFPVPVQKEGRYNLVARADVLAELQRRPHITQAQHRAIIKAQKQVSDTDRVSPAPAETTVEELLAQRRWLTTAEVASVLGVQPAVVMARAKAGTLPFPLEKDPDSARSGYRAAASAVAGFLVTQQPSWPTAEAFAAVPSLSLAEVKRALNDDTPARAGDPATQAYLSSRETISLADYALMLGVAPDTLKRRVQRGHVETVEDPAAKGSQRKLRRIRSDYAAAQLRISATTG